MSEPAVSVMGTALGQLAPSTGSKSGSLPLVFLKRALMFRRLMLQPLGGWWQVTQARPFDPGKASKKGFPLVIVGVLPSRKVATSPLGTLSMSSPGSTRGTPPCLKILSDSGARRYERSAFLKYGGLPGANARLSASTEFAGG